MKKQKKAGIYLLCGGMVLFIILTIIYNVRNYWPGVFSAGFNVNYGLKAVDTVWLNEGNPYHNDTLIYTILRNKEGVFNENSWYADYLRVFSGSVKEDSSIPKFVSTASLDMTDFSEVGYSFAYIHSTLVNHHVSKVVNASGDVPKLYVNITSIDKSYRIVVMNDKQGNLYMMSEGYWNEISK